jgi:peptidase S41-like protein
MSAETNWMEAAQADVGAARITMLRNTPGAVAGVDAAFLKTIDDAYAVASKDAANATNYEGYRAALERFANTFQDDHIWVDFKDPPKRQWPGFLPGYRDGQFIVASTSGEFRTMANARIVSCDNIPVSDIARRNIQLYVTRWSVPSANRFGAPYLFVDIGNPFIHRPERCVFTLNGKTWAQMLQWKPILSPDFEPALRAAQNIAPQPSGGVRATKDGGYWLGIPTLNALNPESLAGLETMMKSIESSADQVRNAKYFVIDLRGNSGGNTFVALRVLNAIWGERTLASVRSRNLRAQWRASHENREYLQSVVPILERLFGPASLPANGLKQILGGFTAAIEHNQPLYVDSDEYAILDAQMVGPQYGVTAQPFLLTDGACVSSCLNLVDLMLSLPRVVQVGDETGADTYYLENRPARLPTGNAVLQIPIKLYTNRERLKNASHLPSLKWMGQMADTDGLESWMSGIASTIRPKATEP